MTVGIMTGVVTVGAASAYLSIETAVLHNAIIPGSISINLEEDEWKEDFGKNIMPGQEIPKNPRVQNVGRNETWMFLKVGIPIRNICIVNPATKRALPRQDTELFEFEASGRWQLISSQRETDTMWYVYGFQDSVKPEGRTDCLFEKIKAVSYLEGEINETESLTIPVTAQAVQKISGEEEDLKIIYQTYLSQEKGGV